MLLVAAEKSDIYTPMIDTINTMYPTKKSAIHSKYPTTEKPKEGL
jgi:hypothetical protein